MSVERVLELHELAVADAGRYTRKRFLYETLQRETGRHFVGILGPRGVGKTVLLRQYAAENSNTCYLSADTLTPDDEPWELIRTLKEHYGFRTFLIDEVHSLPDAAGLLKQLHDFLDIRCLFSSSVALAMHASAHDLSRRVQLHTLHAFSFREYLAFKRDMLLPALTVSDLATGRWRPEHLREGRFFDDYLGGGLLPFALEERLPLPLLESTVEKVIVRDIPSVVRLTIDELACIRKLLRFVGRSGVDGVNYSSVARNLGITKYKAEQYLDCLERAFVLHRVFPRGTNVLREPKVLMMPPCRLLYRDWEDAVGGLREDFFAHAMTQAGIPFHYLKTTRGTKTPDYVVDTDAGQLVIEVGGKGKGREQFKGFRAERKLVLAHALVPEGGRVPLFLLGFLLAESVQA